MFEYLECGHHVPLSRGRIFHIEALSKQVLAVRIQPREAIATIAHDPNQHSVPTTVVQKSIGRSEKGVDESPSALGQANVPAY